MQLLRFFLSYFLTKQIGWLGKTRVYYKRKFPIGYDLYIEEDYKLVFYKSVRTKQEMYDIILKE